jgi:hypothetical protein
VLYVLSVYPSDEGRVLMKHPITFTIGMFLIFGFTLAIFLIYDCCGAAPAKVMRTLQDTHNERPEEVNHRIFEASAARSTLLACPMKYEHL